MAPELFVGSLTILTLAAVIIVVMTTNRRVDYSDTDQGWGERTYDRKGRSDRRN